MVEQVCSSHRLYCLQLFYTSSLVPGPELFNLKSYWIINWNIETSSKHSECLFKADLTLEFTHFVSEPVRAHSSSSNHRLSNLLLNHLTIPRSSSYCQAMFIQDYREGGEKGRGGVRWKYLFSSPQPAQMITHTAPRFFQWRNFTDCLSQHGSLQPPPPVARERSHSNKTSS